MTLPMTHVGTHAKSIGLGHYGSRPLSSAASDRLRAAMQSASQPIGVAQASVFSFG